MLVRTWSNPKVVCSLWQLESSAAWSSRRNSETYTTVTSNVNRFALSNGMHVSFMHWHAGAQSCAIRLEQSNGSVDTLNFSSLDRVFTGSGITVTPPADFGFVSDYSIGQFSMRAASGELDYSTGELVWTGSINETWTSNETLTATNPTTFYDAVRTAAR